MDFTIEVMVSLMFKMLKKESKDDNSKKKQYVNK